PRLQSRRGAAHPEHRDHDGAVLMSDSNLHPSPSSGIQIVGAGPGKGWPRVEGRCPSCGHRSLFVGSGGYVVCAIIGCKDPGSASDLLDSPQVEKTSHRSEAPDLMGPLEKSLGMTMRRCPWCGAEVSESDDGKLRSHLWD